MRTALRIIAALACTVLLLSSCSSTIPVFQPVKTWTIDLEDTQSLSSGALRCTYALSLHLEKRGGNTMYGDYTGTLKMHSDMELGRFGRFGRFLKLAAGYDFDGSSDAEAVPLAVTLSEYNDADYLEFRVTDTALDALPSAQVAEQARAMWLCKGIPFTYRSDCGGFFGINLAAAIGYFGSADESTLDFREMPDTLRRITPTEQVPIPCAVFVRDDGTVKMMLFNDAGNAYNLIFAGKMTVTEKVSA